MSGPTTEGGPAATEPDVVAVGESAEGDPGAPAEGDLGDRAEGDSGAPAEGDPGEQGAASPQAPGGVLTRRGERGFEVHLDNYEGPFDLLLGLISKHRLDVTEIALARVTDEFITHLTAARDAADAEGRPWDLSETSEFLLVAATLLELKAARLLPTTRSDDPEDLALFEARDLLFARLLQYRAFKQVAADFDSRMAGAGRVFARGAGLEERYASLLPELVLEITPEQLALIAAAAMAPRPEPTVGVTHLHATTVSVREQAGILVRRLRDGAEHTFTDLVGDAPTTLVVVARFLAVLELFRDSQVALDQSEALGRLTVRWTGGTGSGAVLDVGSEFDESDPASDPAPPTS